MGGVFSPSKEPAKIDYGAIAKQQAEEERKKTLERQRRGFESTIKTSYSGILSQKDNDVSSRKKLLGD